jgi:hypothetical protein
VYGGDIGLRPTAFDNGTIEFFGRGLVLEELSTNSFLLSGHLSDSTSINVSVDIFDAGAILLHEVPEPSSCILSIVPLACVLLRIRRR